MARTVGASKTLNEFEGALQSVLHGIREHRCLQRSSAEFEEVVVYAHAIDPERLAHNRVSIASSCPSGAVYSVARAGRWRLRETTIPDPIASAVVYLDAIASARAPFNLNGDEGDNKG